MGFITVCFGATKRNFEKKKKERKKERKKEKEKKRSDAVFRDEPKQGSCNLGDICIQMCEINSDLKAVLFSLPQTSLQSALVEFR